MISAILLLAIALTNFSPSISGAMEILQSIPLPTNYVKVEVKPVLVKIKVKILEADMGFSREFIGNETEYEFRPVRGGLVLVMDGAAITTGPSYILRASYFGFTNADGEIVLSAPRGNFTLMINPRPYNRDPACFWRGDVSVDGNETFVVKFFLYRLNPTDISVSLKGSVSESLVRLRFKLPINGSYYLGIPVIIYYTYTGALRLYRQDIGGPLELWGSSIVVERFWINPRVHYLGEWPGGLEIMETLKVGDFPAYISPTMTYLPVEKVSLEELEI